MEFPTLSRGERVIIAMKGLPCTGKSEIARRIGEWARSSVFSIDDSLSTVTMSLEKGYSSQFMPSEEEAERLHRLAFDSLCKSAYRYLRYTGKCVVIKSRLCTSFEIDRLVQLSREDDTRATTTIIIIECHTKNEHRLCARLEDRAKRVCEYEWYKPRSRLDFEKARDDWIISQAHWDLHLCNVINANKMKPAQVIRLVLDPFADLNLGNWFLIFELTPSFRNAITYLLTREHGAPGELDCIGEEIIRKRYEVVQFDKLRRYLVDKELLRAPSTSKKKSKYLCVTTRGGKCCVFKTYKEEEGVESGDTCGVCGERVVSAGYTCHFCILTLHKSCAELQGITFSDFTSNFWLRFHPMYCNRYLTRTYACKSCSDFSSVCNSCLFETHLKCGMLPTIMNHDSHCHPLSLQFGDRSIRNSCKACQKSWNTSTYGCYVCGLYYHMTCILMPGKVEHRHGGHEHVLKLLYSRDGMESEEDYWCGVCYKDMDPQDWFYSCQDCPYYQAHSNCIKRIW